jgi:ribosomal-protein-alanine N-acetyltransferase
MADARVRPVAASHIGDLIRLGSEANLNPWTAQNYLDELQTPNSIMLVIEGANARPIGFIVGRIVSSSVSDTSSDAEIYNVAVAEKHQGKGFGQLLFDNFMESCRPHSVQSVWLEVRESNRQAIDFYARNGFEPVQTRNNFYQNPREHAVLMRLLLKKQTP